MAGTTVAVEQLEPGVVAGEAPLSRLVSTDMADKEGKEDIDMLRSGKGDDVVVRGDEVTPLLKPS